MSARFYLGCAVWAYRGWLGDLYPKGTQQRDFLKLYTERFVCVEGNTTFYAVPSVQTLERWEEVMPPSFKFLPKIPKEISHEGLLEHGIKDTHRFVKHMKRLGSRLGPFHLHLPPKYDPEKILDLALFLREWPFEEAELSVEFRHPGWFRGVAAEQADALLEATGTTRVMLDTRPVYASVDDPQEYSERRKPKLPVHSVVTSDTVFVRFISHPEQLRNMAYLREWVWRVARWLEAGTRVFFFAHCPIEDHSPALARLFQSMLEEEGVEGLPPLPWNLVPEEPKQGFLF